MAKRVSEKEEACGHENDDDDDDDEKRDGLVRLRASTQFSTCCAKDFFGVGNQLEMLLVSGAGV